MYRRHQQLALTALADAWTAGRRRAWVALPPGAGKTLVGLAAARALMDQGEVVATVVLGPNTAIQQQWVAAARGAGFEVTDERTLSGDLSALTYQSVAVFDAEGEVDDDAAGQPLLSQLHDNGRALVAAMRGRGRILVVLDECHHLLEVWGRLLGEILAELPEARVLGLTATPPTALTGDQAGLVAELFGGVVFEASIPAVVREGDLAPFLELAWLTTPTPTEEEWLADQAARFHALVHQLTDPAFGTVPFLEWLDARFLASERPWRDLQRAEPELCRAALRMHHVGLLRLPPGARPTEEHRQEPTADDWVLLLEDWLRRHLVASEDPRDREIVEAVRRVLPSVGYLWTRRGIRRGRSPVDRVLARSDAKTRAAIEIADGELSALGDRMRLLILCDHERASATLPADLNGVLDRQSGSAFGALVGLLGDPVTAGISPLLVTGETVAGALSTVVQLRSFAERADPKLSGGLRIDDLGEGVSGLTGRWTSRRWVPLVTAFFAEGRSQILVGTRALLGEGWDAPSITGLVDLTAATTITSVVQMRGRALRVDPGWAEKSAVNWSVACVSERHPKGGNDWDRLVRKHEGFYAVDDVDEIVDGVGHLDPSFSPYHPPAPAEFAALNARMLARGRGRDGLAARWRVGTPYADRVTPTLRVRASVAGRLGGQGSPAQVVAGPSSLDLRGLSRTGPGGASLGLIGLAIVGGVVEQAAAVPAAGAALPVAVGVFGAAWGLRRMADAGHRILSLAAEPPSVHQVACAVADGLRQAGLVAVGSEQVRVEIDQGGTYRCALEAGEAEAAIFVAALDEAMGPVGPARYLVSRWVVSGTGGWWRRARAAVGSVPADGEVWHVVPTLLGVNADRAAEYGRAWRQWVGGGDVVYTGSPEGAGVLAAQIGSDPFAITSVMRRHWV